MLNPEAKDAFYAVLRSRRSVRDFREEDVPKEVLDRILETGRRSASAANRQPWCFMVARRSEGHPLYELLYGRGLRKAPLLIMGLADRKSAWVRKGDGVNYAWVDVAIALTEMILAATAEGLGSCWIAAFDPAEARRILDLLPEVDPVAMVAFGYPLEPLAAVEKDRKALKEIVRWGARLR